MGGAEADKAKEMNTHTLVPRLFITTSEVDTVMTLIFQRKKLTLREAAQAQKPMSDEVAEPGFRRSFVCSYACTPPHAASGGRGIS